MYILKTRIFQKVGNFRNFGENNRNLGILRGAGTLRVLESENFHENRNFQNFNGKIENTEVFIKSEIFEILTEIPKISKF